ncbi:MAG: histidine phosphatase family protein, partial [Acidimicrobiia bacterium]
LSAAGAMDSREFGSVLAHTEHDIVISSPLSRALETARLVTGLPESEILIRPGCVERDYGEMEGLEPDLIATLRPRVRYVKVGDYHHSLNPPAGESFPALRVRADLFLEDVLEEHRGRAVLIFSHQTFLQQLHGAMLGMDPLECLALDIGNLETNYFLFDRDLRVVTHRRQPWTGAPHTSW